MSGPETISYTEDEPTGIPELPAPSEAMTEDFEAVDAALLGDAWLEDSVREHLTLLGSGLHMIFADGHSEAFEASERDLERIAPPLTRILNRHETLAAWGVISDPLLLGEGVVLYVGRSILQVRALRQQRAEQADAQRDPMEVHYEPPGGSGTSNGSSGSATARSQRIQEQAATQKELDQEDAT